jgi:HSP20 family protein
MVSASRVSHGTICADSFTEIKNPVGFRTNPKTIQTDITLMKLIRYNPVGAANVGLSPLEGFFRQSLTGLPAFDALFGLPGFPGFKSKSPAQASAGLAVDVYEDESSYYARLEVPGVKKEDAKIEIEDRRLSVKVSRKTATAEGEVSIEMARTLTVPEGIEVENISAKLEDGLLTVTLPKAEARKPRLIELN